MKNELYKLSAVDLLSMYKTKETNPLEVSLDIIKQLENKNPQFNAFVCFDKEKMLQQAKLSSERWSSGKVKGNKPNNHFINHILINNLILLEKEHNHKKIV